MTLPRGLGTELSGRGPEYRWSPRAPRGLGLGGNTFLGDRGAARTPPGGRGALHLQVTRISSHEDGVARACSRHGPLWAGVCAQEFGPSASKRPALEEAAIVPAECLGSMGTRKVWVCGQPPLFAPHSRPQSPLLAPCVFVTTRLCCSPGHPSEGATRLSKPRRP